MQSVMVASVLTVGSPKDLIISKFVRLEEEKTIYKWGPPVEVGGRGGNLAMVTPNSL